jgi:hypothetical protein
MTNLFLLCLICYGAGVFSAIGAMFLGRWIGRRQARRQLARAKGAEDYYWRFQQ